MEICRNVPSAPAFGETANDAQNIHSFSGMFCAGGLAKGLDMRVNIHAHIKMCHLLPPSAKPQMTHKISILFQGCFVPEVLRKDWICA